jgi:hypothetical protein
MFHKRVLSVVTISKMLEKSKKQLREQGLSSHITLEYAESKLRSES